jgi:hypothetical protein
LNPRRTLLALTHAFVLAVALGLAAFVCWLKVGSLDAWRYTSDLFTYDQVLAETMAGHFGLEYTYGNTFGDHAYPFLLLFLPLKLLLGKRMVVALLLLPPVAHVVTTAAAYILARRGGADTQTSLIASLLLIFPWGIVQGLYARRYGAHPLDELAGFFAIIMALSFRLADTRRRGWTIAAYLVTFLAFVSLKEETAVLGIVFAGALLLLGRARLALPTLGIGATALFAELIMMQASATPFNDRTMASGAVDFFTRVRTGGLGGFPRHIGREYLLVLGALVAALAIAAVVSRGVDRTAAALFAMGATKIALACVVRGDLDLTTWHNYPGVVMATGALFVQLTAPTSERGRTRTLAWVLAGAAAASFAIWQLPFAREQAAANTASSRLVETYRPALRELIREVDPNSVVAIAPVTAAEWTLCGHHRFTFYPRGVSRSPQGIAEYLVLQSMRVKIRSYYTPPRSGRELVRDHPEFRLVRRNSYFLLFRRIGWTPESRQSRARWLHYFGASSLGRVVPEGAGEPPR